MNRAAVFAICILTGTGLALSRSASALQIDKGQVILEELDDYNFCQSKDYSGDWCHDALKRWVKKNPDDAFKAGKMTRLKMNHWAAIHFFKLAFDAKKGDCKDEDVKLAVVSALNLPGDSYKEVVDSAKKIGIDTCFTDLKDALVAEASLDSYLFKNACKDLSKKGALTGIKAKKCAAQKE